MLLAPRHQFFRRVAPAQSEGRLEDGLSACTNAAEAQKQGCQIEGFGADQHGRSFTAFARRRKTGSAKVGNLLFEAGIAMGLLTFIGLILLKLSLNILMPRQWTVQQTLTNAYMTYERALAERIPFENLTAADSPWPLFPTTESETVTLGRLPGGRAVQGTVTRTRFPYDNNFPIDGGSGTLETNPAAMKVWKVQSVATYKIGGRNYAKSRTILRSQ